MHARFYFSTISSASSTSLTIAESRTVPYTFYVSEFLTYDQQILLVYDKNGRIQNIDRNAQKFCAFIDSWANDLTAPNISNAPQRACTGGVCYVLVFINFI